MVLHQKAYSFIKAGILNNEHVPGADPNNKPPDLLVHTVLFVRNRINKRLVHNYGVWMLTCESLACHLRNTTDYTKPNTN